jgi:hypothetical protein
MTWPGHTAEVRKNRLEIVMPEVLRGPQGHQAPEITRRPDAAEIVFPAKAGVVPLVN